MTNTNLDFYAQVDKWRHLNFGIYLAFPSNYTKQLFYYIQGEFDKSQRWDQSLFNLWIFDHSPKLYQNGDIELRQSLGLCDQPYDYEGVDNNQWINMMLHSTYHYDSITMEALVHSTCIEGSATKAFVVRSFFCSPLPEYYKEHKTVSFSYDIEPRDMPKEAMDILLRALVSVARETKRAIRVPVSVRDGIYVKSQPFATISADYVERLGVAVVEPQYWFRAEKKYGRIPTVKEFNFTLSNLDLLTTPEK